MSGFNKKFLRAIAPSLISVATIAFPAQAENFGLSDGWYKTCSQSGETKICNVQTQTVAVTGQVITSINLFEVTGKENRKIFQVTVPTGRAIPPGLKFVIDDAKEQLMPYDFCTPAVCMAKIKLTDELVGQLKGGGKIQVASTNWRGKENPVLVNLEGFGEAFDGPSLSADQLAERRQKLDQMLKDRSSSSLQKLQEAQKKARENN